MHVATATAPANPGKPNEDFVAASHNTVVLLDGAGNPPGAEQGCIHGVAWFSMTLGTALLTYATEHPNQPLNEALRSAIAAVADLHRDTCDLGHPGSPSATVVALRQVEGEIQSLVLADSVLILVPQDGNALVTSDTREAAVGARFRGDMDALPSGSPEHAEQLRRYIETMRDYRNRTDGFWVASSSPEAAKEAITSTIEASAIRIAILLSDGASRLTDRFGLASWQELTAIVNSAGPEALIGRVRDAENSDPEGHRWPRGKSHDDATAAIIRQLS